MHVRFILKKMAHLLQHKCYIHCVFSLEKDRNFQFLLQQGFVLFCFATTTPFYMRQEQILSIDIGKRRVRWRLHFWESGVFKSATL